MRYPKIFLWIGLCLLASFQLKAEDDPNLKKLIEQALQQNPMLQEAKHRLDAAHYKIPQAGSWDDPMLMVMVEDIPLAKYGSPQNSMTMIEAGIEQRFPFPGKKSTAKAKSTLEAKGYGYELDQARNEIIWQLRDTYYQLYLVTRSIGIFQRNQGLASSAVQTDQTKLSADLSTQQDVLRSQIERDELSKEILDLQKDKQMLQAKLNTLMARDVRTPINLPKRLGLARLPYSNAELVNRMLQQSYVLKANEQWVEAAKKEHRMAKLDYYPDFDVGVFYRKFDLLEREPGMGEDFMKAAVKIPLPIFAGTKQSKRVRETASQYQETLAKKTKTENDLRYELEETLAELTRAAKVYSLVAGRLLPQSRIAVDNAQVAYQAGSVQFTDILLNLQKVFRYENDLLQAEVDHARARAKLLFLIGESE
ncbi:MAG: TolC family protein [Deltaproteobacteria bacterium]|nr:TolC family protein [Deltaproteobacteria bacterium]